MPTIFRHSTKNKHLGTVCHVFMSDILNKATVLVLNRNWQAINVRTPADTFCQMATNVATGLEIEGEEHIRPVSWEEWLHLPIRSQDDTVHTVCCSSKANHGKPEGGRAFDLDARPPEPKV